ncbi:hypothetical protein [Sporisorium scitamineum]|uniref:Uncharacterized protein n=1 Tax=Sporisorium scitamineum TaxID=49012 RepID=A0A0F7RWH1_9BASI|nr:hypothetical protein [Sporisorium scitamineum]
MSEPSSPSMPRLPAEIVADIIELAILTCSPCPRTAITTASSIDEATDDVSSTPKSPFSTPLRSAYTSAWSWTGQLLYVSKFVHSIARPLLLRTLTLDTERASLSFFSGEEPLVEGVRRAWLGSVSALARGGVHFDPLDLRLEEAAWYEECSGGFVVGHAYASRLKEKRKSRGKESEKQYRSVSVYWAEEELIEEVSDPDRSSSDSASEDSDSDDPAQVENGFARSLPLPLTEFGQELQQRDAVEPQQRRSSHQEGAARSARRDPRVDRPHEPAWQTLYSRRRRSSPLRNLPSPGGASSPLGPSEGDLDPWDMQDAQERLAAIANTDHDTVTHETPPQSIELPSTAAAVESTTPPITEPPPTHPRTQRQRTEIYAYHLCTATLEPYINPLLSSIRTLHFITLTFYPGHLLDDDKLEHTLRRILSPSETPRLQTLLIRIVFDASSGGKEVQAIDARQEQERKFSDWSMFFPPSQHANPTHLINLLHHSDPWPDCPNPV